MNQRFAIFKTILNENKYSIGFVYLLYLIEVIFYILIPSSVGLLINTLIDGKGYGIIAFMITYLGCYVASTYRKIKDTIIFTKIFNKIVTDILEQQKKKEISTTKLNARIEFMKQIVEFLEDDLPYFILCIISIFGACILLYFYNHKLLFVSVIIIIPSFIINYFYAKKNFAVTNKINDLYECQIEILDNRIKIEQKNYFKKLRILNIKKSSFEASNFASIQVFVFIMIITSLYIVCKTENINHGSIVASYGIILRLANGFDFIPHATTKLSNLKDITNRLHETFENDED